MFTKVLIAGANSLIAQNTLPNLNFDRAKVFLASRSDDIGILANSIDEYTHIRVTDYSSAISVQTITSLIDLQPTDNLLIINYIGSIGTISDLASLNLVNFGNEILENVNPILTLAKVLQQVPKNGMLVNFSGAGLGGDNLDVASISYLSSKAAMVVLVEALDGILSPLGGRVCGIAPGAFPSKMQQNVSSATLKDVSKIYIDRAKEVMSREPNYSRVISMLAFVIANPGEAGGRIWSANYDTPESKKSVKNFGKFRRIF